MLARLDAKVILVNDFVGNSVLHSSPRLLHFSLHGLFFSFTFSFHFGCKTMSTDKPPVADISKEVAAGGDTSIPRTKEVSVTTTSLHLIHNLVGATKKSRDSWLEFAVHLAYHSVLLAIFFMLSIYKSIESSYRRMYLKYLTLSYYPSKSPTLIRDDVNKLQKIPKNLSCILDLKAADDENGGVEGLINQVSELAAWSLSAGIPHLSIYEYGGILVTQHQRYMPLLNKYITRNLANYFGSEHVPHYSIKIPHKNVIFYSDPYKKVDLEICLLSRVDGKPTIVELTKTMSELAMHDELSVRDINIELVNEELVELVGPEPDLLICFGPTLDLQDYPPWHIRLSELYWEPDNKDVSYAVFIRALQKFSRCKVNVGK